MISASTPYSSLSSSCQWRLTTTTRSGSKMAWRWQSISLGVVKSSTWWTVRTTGIAPAADVPHPGRGPGGHAVLGVEEVEAVGQVGEAGGEGVDRPVDPLLQGVGPGRDREDQVGRGRGPVEADGGVAQGDEGDVGAQLHQRLGQGEGVDHAAPGPGGVGDQRHPGVHRRVATRSGWRRAMAAATSDARAAVGVTMQPAASMRATWAAKPWGSCSVPRT